MRRASGWLDRYRRFWLVIELLMFLGAALLAVVRDDGGTYGFAFVFGVITVCDVRRDLRRARGLPEPPPPDERFYDPRQVPPGL